MKASSESGLWATWMICDMCLVANFRERLRFRAARLLQGGVDIGFVVRILLQLRCALGGGGSNEPLLECRARRRVASKARGLDSQDETEQVRGILPQDRISLRTRYHRIAADDSDHPDVVAVVCIGSTEHLVCLDRHWGEDTRAVQLSLGTVAHHTIEEPRGALFRRHL